MERIILHSDLNNFFASVEATKNPCLRGKTFAVAGNPEKRHGIILAKSQAAKETGVSTGEAIWEAKQKCPSLLLVPPDMPSYFRYSEKVREIYRQFTDEVEPFGIDEAWLDVSGSTRLFGSGAEIAQEIRRRVREELGLTVSVGVSFNKIFAKLGSDLKKPDATTLITRENFKQIVHPLPVSALLFVGRSTKEKLARYGIHTIGQLARTDPSFLTFQLGKWGAVLYQYANGSDLCAPLTTTSPPLKSISNSVTTERDLKTKQEVWVQLLMLAEQVASRMRIQRITGDLITLQLRTAQLQTKSRQWKMSRPTNTALDLAKAAFSILPECWNSSTPLRSVGLGVGNLQPDDESYQLTFWNSTPKDLRTRQLDQAVDQLRNRYGFNCIVRAECLNRRLKNYTISHETGAPASLCTLPGCRH